MCCCVIYVNVLVCFKRVHCLMPFLLSTCVVIVLHVCLFVLKCVCVVTCSACGVSCLSVLVDWWCVCCVPGLRAYALCAFVA